MIILPHRKQSTTPKTKGKGKQVQREASITDQSVAGKEPAVSQHPRGEVTTGETVIKPHLTETADASVSSPRAFAGSTTELPAPVPDIRGFYTYIDSCSEFSEPNR